MKDLPRFIVSIVLCELTGIASAVFSLTAIPVWYTTLVKPSFAPPNWLFGPVWTLLYFLMGVAWYLVWQQGWKKKVKTAGYYFFIQLFLNFSWSLFFFGLRSPLLGLINIVVLLIFIVATMKQFYGLSKTAFYLLAPYIFWVCFATILNIAIVVLN